MEAMATSAASIVTEAGSVMSFVWGLFGQLLGVVTSNALIAIPVLMAILIGGIGIAMKVVRRFGVRGKR